MTCHPLGCPGRASAQSDKRCLCWVTSSGGPKVRKHRPSQVASPEAGQEEVRPAVPAKHITTNWSQAWLSSRGRDGGSGEPREATWGRHVTGLGGAWTVLGAALPKGEGENSSFRGPLGNAGNAKWRF